MTPIVRAALVSAWRRGVPRPWSWLLAPAAWAYRAGLGAHRGAYRAGLRRATRLPCRVVSVGNLTVGGTGKTPLVELVARRLQEEGRRVLVLSRGYGRRGAGTLVVSDGQRVLLDAATGGDEPVLLARRLPGVPVVVGRDRGRAGAWAVERLGADVVLLDDGFQHHRVARDAEVVCLDARSPWGPGRLLPAGPLREPPSALARAHLIVLTAPEAGGDFGPALAAVRRQAPAATVALAVYEPCGLTRVVPGGLPEAAGDGAPAWAALRDVPVLAFAGIAAPERFAATLVRGGLQVRAVVAFPDHHRYAAPDLAHLEREAGRLGARALVTTEKDAVRLPRPVALPVWVAGVRLVLIEGAGAFWATLEARLR
jgi:tetraacyldisaccharide 4'-kinase